MQNLFSRDVKQDFTTPVLILLTPRRVATFSETMEAGEKLYKSFGSADEPDAVREARGKALKDLGGAWPNLPLTLRHMERNKMFKGVRTGDIRLEDWDEPSKLERILLGAVEMFYR